jgi:hypothetical protein
MKEKAAAAAQGKMMASVDVMITELSQLKFLLAKVGVHIGDIEVTLGVPPSVNADVEFPDMAAINRIPEALKGVKLSTTQKTIVDSVVSLARFRETAQNKFSEILGGLNIKAGFPPTFIIRLKDVEPAQIAADEAPAAAAPAAAAPAAAAPAAEAPAAEAPAAEAPAAAAPAAAEEAPAADAQAEASAPEATA